MRERPVRQHQQYVQNEEAEDEEGEDEMQAAGGLPAAKHVHQPRKGRFDAGADRQAGKDHHRQEDAENDPVRQFLQEIVFSTAVVEVETQMGANIFQDGRRTPFAGPGGDIPGEVAVDQHRDPHEQQQQRKRPRHQDMPVARERKAVISRDRHPVGKARYGQPGLFGRKAPIAPIQASMGVRYGQTRHEQDNEADQIGPVPQAGRKGMALHGVSPSRARYMTSRS